MEILNNSTSDLLIIAIISAYILLLFLRVIYYTFKSVGYNLLWYKINKPRFFLKNLLFVIWFIALIMAYLWVNIDFSIVNKTWPQKDIIFVLDVSKSMDVQDMWWNNTSRLEYTKNIIWDFVSKNIWNNYSLYIFAGKTANISPLTVDVNWFLTNLNSINTSSISTGWTKIKDAIEEVVVDFSKDNNPKNIILLSDWWDELENNDIDSINIDRNKVKIFTIGIGTTKWDYIPDWADLFWNMRYKTYQWETIVSKLNPDILELLAKKWNWEYLAWTNKNILDNIKLKLLSNNSTKNSTNREFDWTYLFVIIAFILFSLWYIIDYKDPLWKN